MSSSSEKSNCSEESDNDNSSNEGETSEALEIDASPSELSSRAEDRLINKCICLETTEISHIQHVFDGLIQKSDCGIETLHCIRITVEKMYNLLIDSESGEVTVDRLAFADSYYRLRHELLASHFISMFPNISVNSRTDVKFSNFNIDSERTPDYIFYNDGQLYIIEVTVSVSEEKVAQTKGIQEAGFESKYEREIKMLREKGYVTSYYVVFFNMQNPEESNYKEVAESLSLIFPIESKNLLILSNLVQIFHKLTYSMKNYLSPASMMLFSKTIKTVDKHDSIKFLYTNDEFTPKYKYMEFNVSIPVYKKINSIWTRMVNIKERQIGKSDSFEIILDIAVNNLEFYNVKNGMRHDEFMEIIVYNKKREFFEKLKLRVSGRVIRAKDTETGVRYMQRYDMSLDFVDRSINKKFQIDTDHTSVLPNIDASKKSNYEMYDEKVKYHLEDFMYPVYYDENYEDTYIKGFLEMDTRQTQNLDISTYTLNSDFGLPTTLASYETQNFNMKAISEELLAELINRNTPDTTTPIVEIRMKSSFILPMAALTERDRCKLDHKNETMISNFSNISKLGEYTCTILRKTLDPNYKMYTKGKQPSENLSAIYEERSVHSNALTKVAKDYMRREKVNFDRNNLKGAELETFQQNSSRLSEINKTIRRMEKEEGIVKDISLIRLSLGSKSAMSISFRREMEHFRNKTVQSTIEGVGVAGDVKRFKSKLDKEFTGVMSYMTNNCGENDDFLIDDKAYDDTKMLQDLKEKTIDDYRSIINQVKNSALGHSSAFVSRYAHSLMFYSQLPFNKNYVRVDNLGYKNVLLIVRGGSKVFKTKSSKMHRLIFPVSDEMIGQYVDEGIGANSYYKVVLGSQNYIVTPWILLHESILADSISFYSRICSFCVLNSNINESFSSQIHRYFLNVLLAFHNRRKTEEMLANLRYILLSTMGDYSAFTEIMGEFIGFNYDKVQAYLRINIIENYPKYYECMRRIQSGKSINVTTLNNKGLKNLVTNYDIDNMDDLTLMIYSTFLMTKAPYQKSVERATNLRSILKIHTQFDSEVGLALTESEQLEKISVCLDTGEDVLNLTRKDTFEEYSKELMSCDFFIDPKYCTNLGIFMNCYFENNVGKEVLITEWIKIINKNWDSMATTTGLRGMDNDNFWGQKGFFVIYDKILNDYGYKNRITEIFHSDLTDDSKRKLVRNLNMSYSDYFEDIPKTLVYHAVDKRQWRGSREIYVMDLETKRMQQTIEKYMAFLCKKTDTELISIPSDKRSQIIHHTLFEKDLPDRDMKTWFLTFDCSKWAPKSMFIKFALMIIPITCIPVSFKKHFLNYISLLYSKRLYFNNPEVKVLLNNPSKDSGNEFLISDKEKNGYYMIQPYSWVMGIFNYTSSLMHAFNQKYCSYLLRETTMMSFNEECDLTMYAHSDDSGGRLVVSNENFLVRALFFYEINLKACNHLLSRKKCVVSRIYFEILSIIYMFSELLALLPKFLGGIRFLPTDKGPSHDMLQSYSKCIEVLNAGADFSRSYLFMKFYSAEIWRFYHSRRPIIEDYKRPVQYLGMPDSHPLMTLLTGSDSDIIRIIHSHGYDEIIKSIRLFDRFELYETDEGMVKPLKFIVKIRNLSKNFNESIGLMGDLKDKWSLANVNYRNTIFDSLTFLKKLNDPGFVGSLVNETEIRRISRAFFFRSGVSVKTKLGNKKLSEIMSIIEEMNAIIKSEDLGVDVVTNFFNPEDRLELLNEISMENENNIHIPKFMNDVYANPLKLYKYFNKMNFNPMNLKQIRRTIKPTHIQILKFGRGFSMDFDPAQLISYIYEPELRWALPNPDNLKVAEQDFNSLLTHLKIEKDSLNQGSALKLVRAHLNKSVKDIYLYSSIPGHIRVIKNFSSILSFLATNSFPGHEIQGLVLKLRANLSASASREMEIDDEAYYISTLLDVVTTLGRHINPNAVTFQPNEQLGFLGGEFSEFLDSIGTREFNDPNYIFYQHYLHYNRNKFLIFNKDNKGDIFKKGAFYTYLKEQKFKGHWYGKGVILFYFNEQWIKLDIYNSNVIKAEGSFIGKIDRRLISYLSDLLSSNNLETGFNEKIIWDHKNKTQLYLGYDIAGEVSIDIYSHMRGGIKYDYTPTILDEIVDIFNSELEFVKENLFRVKTMEGRNYKIYTLKIEKSEILPIIKTVIDQKSLETFLLSNAYDDFTDFIKHNILTSYGAEFYISLMNFKESCQGSMLYRIMCHIQSCDNKLFPTRFKTAKLPAPEGSLLRMVISYQESTDTSLISTISNLNPSIMQIRNEYPESFSVVLHEKLVENFDNIYSDEEQLQLTTEFVRAAGNYNPDKVRESLIKLMCYWGYSSLINVIQTYTFSKTSKNHNLFSMDNYRNDNKNIYNKSYITLINAIFDSLEETYDVTKKIDSPLKNLMVQDISFLRLEYITNVVYNCYNYTMPYYNPSLANLKLNNILIGMMKDPSFVKSLTNKLKDSYPLNSLNFEPSITREIITTCNTLRLMYINSKKQDTIFNLVHDVPYSHIPHNVTQPLSLIKEVSNNLKNLKDYRSGKNKLNFFASESLLNELKKDSVVVFSEDKRYLVKQRIIKTLSDVEIPTMEGFNFDNVLTEEFLESDEYSDISYELISVDPDEELIEESLQNAKENMKMYQKSGDRKQGKSDIIHVDWLIYPYKEGYGSISKWANNTSEHLVILTNNMIKKFEEVRFNHAYIVNYSTFEKEMPDMFCFVMSTKKVKSAFWDKYIGGRKIHNYYNYPELTYSNLLRVKDKIKGTSNMGEVIGRDLKGDSASANKIEDIKNPIDCWLKLNYTEEEAMENLRERNEMAEIIKDVERQLSAYLDKGVISQEKYNEITKKYKDAALSRVKGSRNVLLHSFFSEMELININQGVISGDIGSDITDVEQIKMIQAPESFGAAFNQSVPDSRCFKDMRLKAELDSINPNLGDLVASATLSISEDMFKVAKSNFTNWRYSVEGTKYQRERKQFFLNLFLSLINTSNKPRVSRHDPMWQEIINNFSMIIGEEPVDDVEKDLGYRLSPVTDLRMKYNISTLD